MLRSAFIVFLLGWTLWFWIDKPPPGQQRLPEVSDSLVENFQVAFNILKSGYPKVAYVYIWNAHYLLLSILGGLLLALITGAVSDALGRRRMRRLILPARPVGRADDRDEGPREQSSAPADKQSTSE
jgi:hypothetical protein